MLDLKKDYFTKQIITYLGNKRSLLEPINDEILFVKEELKKDKLITADLFSGSGIVSRLLKEHSSYLVANDLEEYSEIINKCYLSNKSDFNKDEYEEVLAKIMDDVNKKPITNGIIRKNYAPKDENNITKEDRCFYTIENAIFIDSFRHYIDKYSPEKLKIYYLAQLIAEASNKNNTCGVFKGFYKSKDTGIGKYGGDAENALKRIKCDITITEPVFSDNECEYKVYREDAVALSESLTPSDQDVFDLVYLDPPYNQHPYGSNYFMLNLIAENKIETEISKVSGIPTNWNRSDFNKKGSALGSLEKIIKNIKSKYVLISYNNEGFITYDEMYKMLKKYGSVSAKEIQYNTFRGSRNLRNRNIHTNEFLFLLKKGK